MMSKRAKLLVTLGIAAVLAGSGTALAATTDNTTTQQQEKAPFHGKKMLKVPFTTELPSFLGMTEEELRTAREAGQSLAQIAEGKGITEAKLLEFMKTQHQKQLDQMLADGTITQEQADDLKAHMADEHLQRLIDSTGKMGGRGHGHGGKGDFLLRGPVGGADLTTFLGLTEEEMRTAMQEGKTLAQIAADQGITEDKLIEFLQTEQQKHLDQLVTDGKITQEQADQMKERMTAEQFQEKINGTGKMMKKFRGGHGGHGKHGGNGKHGFPGTAPVPETDGAASSETAVTPTAL